MTLPDEYEREFWSQSAPASNPPPQESILFSIQQAHSQWNKIVEL